MHVDESTPRLAGELSRFQSNGDQCEDLALVLLAEPLCPLAPCLSCELSRFHSGGAPIHSSFRALLPQIFQSGGDRPMQLALILLAIPALPVNNVDPG